MKENGNKKIPYFPAHKMHRPIRHTVIFSLEILEENNDECILILVIYWKKTGFSNHIGRKQELATII